MQFSGKLGMSKLYYIIATKVIHVFFGVINNNLISLYQFLQIYKNYFSILAHFFFFKYSGKILIEKKNISVSLPELFLYIYNFFYSAIGDRLIYGLIP